MDKDLIRGDLVTATEVIPFHLLFEDDELVEWGKGPGPSGLTTYHGDIHPAPVNLHSHIGDRFIGKIRKKMSVEELVAPPNGYKHQRLREASDLEKRQGMETAIREMAQAGITKAIDFREGGVHGTELLHQTLENMTYDEFKLMPGGSLTRMSIFGRPSECQFDKEEMEALAPMVNGIGISGIGDWDLCELTTLCKWAKSKDLPFAIHASEAEREDIDEILSLGPSMLIHLNKATEDDLLAVKEAGVPVVICPSSTDYFKLGTNFVKMTELGMDVGWGSDNAMFGGLTYCMGGAMETILLQHTHGEEKLPDGRSIDDIVYNNTFHYSQKIISSFEVTPRPTDLDFDHVIAVSQHTGFGATDWPGPKRLWRHGPRKVNMMIYGIDIKTLLE